MPTKTLPLTAAQQGVWFAQQLDPDNPIYKAAEAVDVDGPLDVALLEGAIRRAVDETEALRAAFLRTGQGHLRQVIDPSSGWDLPVLDLRGRADPVAAAEAWMRADLAGPVDLERPPLFSFALLRTGERRWTVYFGIHHVLLDGYGFSLFIQRVAELYAAAEEDRAAAPCPFGSFEQALAEEAEYEASERFAADRRFWADRLTGWPTAGNPTASSSVVPRTSLRETGHLAPADAAGLRALARRAKTGLPSVAMAALVLYVHRLAGEDDVSLELTVNGRSTSASRRVPSMVAGVLPLRVSTTPSATVAELVRDTAAAAKDLLRHQRFSTTHLVRDLGIAPHRGGYLGDWGINIMMHDAELRFGRHPAVLRNLSNGPVTGLGVNVYDRPADGSLRIDFNSDPARYDAEALSAHHRRFLALLRTLATTGLDRELGEVELLDERERALVLHEWNDTALPTPDTTLPALFEAQVRAAPDATALVCGATRLSAAELNLRANRLAHSLIARGAGPETFVALALPRCADYVVALLAVLKAGAACVPLDAGHPPARLRALLAETGPLCVLATARTGATLPPDHPVVLLDEVLDEVDPDRWPGTDPVGTHRPHHPAYVSFTSGSTGRPKAVVVEHRQLANLFHDHRAELLGPARGRLRSAVTASFCFDTSWEGVVFLAAGQEVHLVDDAVRLDPAALVRYFRRHRIDFADLTPSVLRTLLARGLFAGEERFPWLLMVGGEAIDPVLWRTLRECPGIEAWNYYGPTEATVDAVYCRITGEQPVIGRPGHNVRAYVLDRALRPQPPLVPGELHLSGAQVARGYLGQPGLTAQRFLPDPFGPPGARMYRTGDVVRWTGDGALEYLGRTDDQVKVSGVRIEPGEVEAVLLAHPRVAEAVVTTSASALSAHVVPARRPLDEAELRSWVAERLPTSMVPSSVVLLDRLPLTEHGKLDRSALPAPEVRAGRAARTLREKQLCALFAEVLGVAEVGADSSFFTLGGNSLLAAELVSRLGSELGAGLPLGAVYGAPTAADLARLIDRATPSRAFDALLPLRAGGSRPPLFCVHPVGGLAWCYAGLPHHLPDDVPVYGLQVPGLVDPDDLPTTFHQMIDGYVRRIRSVRPTGPYHLLGWSIGGALAHAIAARLRSEGEDVGLLALLDARPIDPGAVFEGQDVLPLLLEAAGLTSDGRCGLGERDIGTLTAVLAHFATLVPTYHDSVFDGDVLYFEATEGDRAHGSGTWCSRVTGRVVSHGIACTHHAMTQAEPLAVVGGLISRHLRDRAGAPDRAGVVTALPAEA
ncbi:amino acid adenylation domain-containing protein [Saccharothrix sp. BKS2]|uniref:amino acid adenylation domain-containing protein n=1 Tax=Saccharothrix sp. BKS2 TaxID=3064400 RepID=UPI0039E85DE9